MTIKTITLTAPSAWASAIVNIDYNGLSLDDRKQLNTFLANNNLSFSDCIGWKSAGFCNWHDAFNECPLSADCIEYTWRISA